MLTVGVNEVLIIFGILLLLFGAHKIPEAARAIGKSIGEYKKAKIESEIEVSEVKENER